MASPPPLDFGAFVERRRGVCDGAAHRRYAYVSDKKMRAIFARLVPVELAIAATVRAYKAFGKNQLLGHAVQVGPSQFPRVHALARRAAHELGVAAPTVYIMNQPTLNAATYGTEDDSFILVHSALVDHLSDDELLDILGHECGHIQNNHVVYLTTLHMLTQMSSLFASWLVYPAKLALLAWSRRAEITCDRAGLLSCKDLAVSTKSLAKLALGSQKLYDELDVDAFVDQHREGRLGVGKLAEALASHPWLPKRVLALRAFAESELFRAHAGLGPGGLSMDEVDARVHDVIKVV